MVSRIGWPCSAVATEPDDIGLQEHGVDVVAHVEVPECGEPLAHQYLLGSRRIGHPSGDQQWPADRRVRRAVDCGDHTEPRTPPPAAPTASLPREPAGRRRSTCIRRTPGGGPRRHRTGSGRSLARRAARRAARVGWRSREGGRRRTTCAWPLPRWRAPSRPARRRGGRGRARRASVAGGLSAAET